MNNPETLATGARGRFRLKAGELSGLSVKSNAAGLRRWLAHWLAIVLAAAMLVWLSGDLSVPSVMSGLSVLRLPGLPLSSLSPSMAWPLAVLLTLLLGYLLAFQFSVLHECAHQTAFRSRRLNLFAGHLAAWLIVLPYHYYRAFHWDHHRHTQDPLRDPELAGPLPSTPWAVFMAWSGIAGWRLRWRGLLRHAIFAQVPEPWVPADQQAAIVRESRYYLLAYVAAVAASIYFGSLLLVWIWLVPMVIGQWFIRPYLLVEHTGCANSADILANTRTTYTNAFVRFFAWNMPYHAEHHAYPAVPFHALPALNRKMAEHLTQTELGYLRAWREVLRFLLREGDTKPHRRTE